jgi:hypothetical protein
MGNASEDIYGLTNRHGIRFYLSNIVGAKRMAGSVLNKLLSYLVKKETLKDMTSIEIFLIISLCS